MLRSVVIGSGGRMGGRIISLMREDKDFKLVGAIERSGHNWIGSDIGEMLGLGRMDVKVSDDLSSCIDNADVIIDFTNPEATLKNLEINQRGKVPVVIGTTGFTAEQREEMKRLLKGIRCVLSPNMSIGVNILFKIVEDVARVLRDGYDIEIIEAHHRFKKDAPSGTAMKLAEIIASSIGRALEKDAVYGRRGMIGERKNEEIAVFAVRAGDIVGEHAVIFGGLGERIEITHRAHSRDNFARGALRAAKWIVNQKEGIYDMMDVLGLR